MVCTLKKILNSPGGGDILKEHVQAFDVDYITQNNRSSYLLTIITIDCS